MVWRVANMSATSRACRAREIWRPTRQMDKEGTSTGQNVQSRVIFERTCSLWRAERRSASILVTSYGASTKMLYEKATRKLVPWNFAFTECRETRQSVACMREFCRPEIPTVDNAAEKDKCCNFVGRARVRKLSAFAALTLIHKMGSRSCALGPRPHTIMGSCSSRPNPRSATCHLPNSKRVPAIRSTAEILQNTVLSRHFNLGP